MDNYSSRKLALLSLKWAMAEKFRDLLLGAKIIVYTDNNPLCHLQTSAKLGATELHWSTDVAQFDYEIKYRCGKSNNANADALCRKKDHGREPREVQLGEIVARKSEVSSGTAIPRHLYMRIREMTADVLLKEIDTRSPETVKTALATFPSIPTAEIAQLQTTDPDIKRFIEYWRKRTVPSRRVYDKETKAVKKLLKSWERIVEVGGILYRNVFQNGVNNRQLLLPVSLVVRVLEAVHDQAGHQSAEKTLLLARARCYWPAMSADITAY